MLISSAPYEDPHKGWQVLHFPVPFSAEGVSIEENWLAMGMWGTGSHTMICDDVFIPDEAVALRRPRGDFHAVWNVVLTMSMPFIMRVYVGIAESAVAIAREKAMEAVGGAAYFLTTGIERLLRDFQAGLFHP